MTLVLLEGTVPTGLESTALEEVQEKLKIDGTIQTGRVFFETFMELIPQILQYGSFERVYVVILKTKDVVLPNDVRECENELRKLVSKTDWSLGFDAWETVYGPFPGSKSRSLNRFDEYLAKTSANENRNLAADDNDVDGPKFRVTCHREGKEFCFTSMQAAAFYGGEIHNCFHWKADMEHFDLELILRINKQDVAVSIPLNTRCSSFRNLLERGVACLKASICYGLLRLCRLEVGDVVCDPMVGSGSILLEAFTHWPHCQYVGGDIQRSLLEFCTKNRQYLNDKLSSDRNRDAKSNVEFFVWDATRTPLKAASVDCVISDLPFGKRCGSMTDNKILYRRLLKEISRITRPVSGRAVLLTYDRRNMQNVLPAYQDYFQISRSFVINVGGLFSGVYVLQRNETEYV